MSKRSSTSNTRNFESRTQRQRVLKGTGVHVDDVEAGIRMGQLPDWEWTQVRAARLRKENPDWYGAVVAARKFAQHAKWQARRDAAQAKRDAARELELALPCEARVADLTPKRFALAAESADVVTFVEEGFYSGDSLLMVIPAGTAVDAGDPLTCFTVAEDIYFARDGDGYGENGSPTNSRAEAFDRYVELLVARRVFQSEMWADTIRVDEERVANEAERMSATEKGLEAEEFSRDWWPGLFREHADQTLRDAAEWAKEMNAAISEARLEAARSRMAEAASEPGSE